jgi:electron-transferring-flavoprotein dehydrogenase
VNWPVPSDVYAGSFMYHMGPNLVHLGMVVGLDYKNPYLNPYEEFQKLKTHKIFREVLEGG